MGEIALALKAIGQVLDLAGSTTAVQSETINIRMFEQRKQLIADISLLNSLPALISRATTILEVMQNEHLADVKRISALLSGTVEVPLPVTQQPQIQPVVLQQPLQQPNHMRNAQPTAWAATESVGESTVGEINIDEPAKSWTVVHRRKPNNTTAVVKITDKIAIGCISVSTFDSVKADGRLYYVDTADHFAIKIGNKLFHGNIGTVYTDEKSPEKIKDCKFASTCTKIGCCDYYHNPMIFAGSRDRRNFIASSFLYTSPGNNYKYKHRTRRFGSRDNLDIDIATITEEERNRFYDQTMHDLLCSLILAGVA